MHKYMRSIGFTKKMSKEEQEALFALILKNPDDVEVWNRKDGLCYSEIEKDIAYNIGICLRGEGILGEDFEPEYFFPYIKSTNMKAVKEVSVERHADKESYAAVCDEETMNLSIIFYLQNAFEYLSNIEKLKYGQLFPTISFSGLCIEGKILCPVHNNAKESQITGATVRNEMAELARNGDQKAAEALAIDNINEYQQLSRRMMKEDVYSIVERSFIPYGVECDNYMVIGDILNVASAENFITKEKIWILNVKSREITMDICINHKDLLGEPAVGRRFKGDIWLQGYIAVD